MEVLNNSNRKINPDAGSAYGAGWDIMWKTFIPLLLVTIVYGLISGVGGGFQFNLDSDFQWGPNDFSWLMAPIILFAIGFGVFVSGPIGYSVKGVFLKAVRGEHVEIKDMFSVFRGNYWNAVLGNILVGIIVGIGILMLIVPGIIFACRLAFVPYLIIDRDMEVTEALSKSWEMTKGYGWNIFFMGFLSIWIVLLGLLALFFGVIISAIWISTSFAALYQAVVEEEGHFQDAVTT